MHLQSWGIHTSSSFNTNNRCTEHRFLCHQVIFFRLSINCITYIFGMSLCTCIHFAFPSLSLPYLSLSPSLFPHTHTHTHTHTCTHAHMHARTHTCMYACTHACMHVHPHTHTRTHTHSHIHTHTYTHSILESRIHVPCNAVCLGWRVEELSTSGKVLS